MTRVAGTWHLIWPNGENVLGFGKHIWFYFLLFLDYQNSSQIHMLILQHSSITLLSWDKGIEEALPFIYAKKKLVFRAANVAGSRKHSHYWKKTKDCYLMINVLKIAICWLFIEYSLEEHLRNWCSEWSGNVLKWKRKIKSKENINQAPSSCLSEKYFYIFHSTHLLPLENI